MSIYDFPVAQVTHPSIAATANALIAAAASASSRALMRVEQPIPSRDPIAWLQQQRDPLRLFWGARDSDFSMAAVGAVDVLTDGMLPTLAALFAELRARLPHDNPAVRYYGGVAFNPQRQSDGGWQQFGRFRFILPRFELLRRGATTQFAVNFRPDDLDDTLAALHALDFAEFDGCPSLPAVHSRTDYPDHGGWVDNINTALETFDDHRAEKIVLARRTTLAFETPIDALALARRLHTAAPNAFHFCFQLDDETAFVGATPERLYWRHGRMLHSEALAGTRRRGVDFIEDRKFRKQLLYDKKERHEHMLVQNAILQALQPWCASVSASEHVTVKVLERVQHRYSRIQGILAPHTTDAELLAALHPTPAVGGLPKLAALEAIARLEPFDRGWYAAPVGWVGRDSAEFAVAIRSGLVENDRLSLYAGAGIVPGSVPESEWQELENKLGNFRKLWE